MIRLLSWNLYQRPWIVADWLDTPRLPDRRARFLGILEQVPEADVACLQEAFHGPTRRALARRFPHSFRKLAHRFCLRVHSGLMILSRLPILERDGLIFEGGRGADAWVDKGVMLAGIGGIRFFNTHLQSGPHPRVRSEQIAALRDFLVRYPGPAVLVGDFNLHHPGDPALDPIHDLGFRDVQPDLKMDRVLVRDVPLRDVRLAWSRWSDHAGIVAELA